MFHIFISSLNWYTTLCGTLLSEGWDSNFLHLDNVSVKWLAPVHRVSSCMQVQKQLSYLRRPTWTQRVIMRQKYRMSGTVTKPKVYPNSHLINHLETNGYQAFPWKVDSYTPKKCPDFKNSKDLVLCLQKPAIGPSYDLGETNEFRKTVNTTTFVE